MLQHVSRKKYEQVYHHGGGTYRTWGPDIATENPVIVSYRSTLILQMADVRQHCQISKYEEIRLWLKKGVEPVENCSQYVDV
jgi:hypothetical protein